MAPFLLVNFLAPLHFVPYLYGGRSPPYKLNYKMQCSQKVGQKKWSHNSSQETSRTSSPIPPLLKCLLMGSDRMLRRVSSLEKGSFIATLALTSGQKVSYGSETGVKRLGLRIIISEIKI